MALDLELLYKDINGTVTLILPPHRNPAIEGVDGYPYKFSQPRPIIGIMTGGGVSIGGSNTFAGGNAGSNYGQGFDKLLSQYDKSSNKLFADYQILSVNQTLKSWQSSNDFSIPIEITFMALTSNLKTYKPDYVSGTNDVRLPVRELLSLVYPQDFGTIGGGDNLIRVYNAPNGYTAKTFAEYDENNAGKVAALGTCQIAFGNWLSLRHMVCHSVSCQFSKETQRNGTPLSATVRLEFVAYRSYSYNDIVKMFNSQLSVDVSKELFDIAQQEGNAPKVDNLANVITNGIDNLLKSKDGIALRQLGADAFSKVANLIPRK